jgi:excisionase family DNA binding protein
MADNDTRLPRAPAQASFYSIEEVAELLGLHRGTISRFISSGELRAARLGHRTVRVTHEALMDFLKSKEQENVKPRPNRERRAAGGKKS